MADSFFGFGAEMPALGAGRLDNHNDGLLNNRIDMLNDETFGDGALFGEDWEEEHKRMSKEHETVGHLYDSQSEQWMTQALRESPLPENELESSLNKLVVDDEVSSIKGQCIPGRHAPVDLDNLFGPSSPAGLFGAEDLVSGHQNIWGSPSTKGSHLRHQDDGLKVLLKQMQKSGGVPVIPGLSTSLPQALTLDQIEGAVNPDSVPTTVPRAMTVQELENQMTGGAPSVKHIQAGRAQGIPMNATREQSPPHHPQMPIGTPPQRVLMPQMRPGIPMPNGAMVHSGPRAVGPVAGSPANYGFYPGRPGSVESSPLEFVGSPLQGNRMPQPKTPNQQRMPPQHANTDPLHQRQRVGHHPNQPPHPASLLQQDVFQERGRFDERMQLAGRHEPFMHRQEQFRGLNETFGPGPRGDFRSGPLRNERGGFVANGRGYPHASMERRGFSHQNGDRGGYHPHPRDWEGHYYPDRGRGGGPPPHYITDERDHWKRGPGEHFAFKQRHMVGPAGDGEDENESRDPYAELMSKKEKDWIIKIQLLQLSTDNPYLDDYYYTVWHIKKLALEREEQRKRENKDVKEPALVLPQLAGRVETRAYMPTQFENSLGRLTAASVHNPRRVIDLRSQNSLDKDDIKGREVKRFKKLLLDVETAYDVLLVIDDMEKRAHALPQEQRAAVFDNRRKAVHSLFLSLQLDIDYSDYFERLVTLRKGIKLVARLLPLLLKDEAIQVTQELLRYTHDIMNKKGWTRDVLPQVYSHIAIIFSASKLEHLVAYAKSLQGDKPTQYINAALQNQFASSVIWCLLNRGEVVYKTESPLDFDVQDQKDWCELVENVADCLAVLETTIAQNEVGSEHADSIAEHFKRLLDRGSYLSVEDKLLELCVPFARES